MPPARWNIPRRKGLHVDSERETNPSGRIDTADGATCSDQRLPDDAFNAGRDAADTSPPGLQERTPTTSLPLYIVMAKTVRRQPSPLGTTNADQLTPSQAAIRVAAVGSGLGEVGAGEPVLRREPRPRPGPGEPHGHGHQTTRPTSTRSSRVDHRRADGSARDSPVLSTHSRFRKRLDRFTSMGGSRSIGSGRRRKPSRSTRKLSPRFDPKSSKRPQCLSSRDRWHTNARRPLRSAPVPLGPAPTRELGDDKVGGPRPAADRTLIVSGQAPCRSHAPASAKPRRPVRRWGQGPRPGDGAERGVRLRVTNASSTGVRAAAEQLRQ